MSEEVLLNQEEVNEVVKKRLDREKRKYREEVEALKARIAELEGEGNPEEEETPEEEPEASDEQTEDKNDEQAEYKAKYLNALKQAKLLDAGFSFDQISKYEQYVTGESSEEIERQALELSQEVQSHNTSGKGYADPGATEKKGVWNPFQ
ncbi:hypothetical protein MUN88_19105 [Gracilibacillus caseinilyticus]|uniref:Phage minor structural protein GP20 n=1 Tax=Gracilibacillus caseinilyticus TaxID=2932256 RepID=A0ABY4EUN9_9BACI|nr:hypothetical protein [Gracilibacillus caseinilyticus]UOQ48128.1 hypothetical protein MUN88_19105 [Gracilibacillus caseinilyticus]